MAFKQIQPQWLIDDTTGTLGYKNPMNGTDVTPPSFSLDANGNPVGILGSKGAVLPVGSTVAGDRYLLSKGIAEQAKSVATSRAGYEDTASSVYTEPWTDMSQWVMQATPGMQVSANVMYSVGTQGGGSGGNHSYALAANQNLRAVFKVNIITGGGGGGVIIGVSKDTAAAVPTAGGGAAFGLYFTASTTVVQSVDSGTFTPLSSQAAVATGTYIVTVTVDQTYISVTACKTDGTGELYARRLRAGFAVNNLYLFNSDARSLTGHSVGLLSARKSLQTISPRTFSEGVAKTFQWTGDGTQNFTVQVPSTYDSRVPSPVAIMFHGNASDETHWLSNPNGQLVARALVNAGYIVVGCTLASSGTTWGNAASTAAYYAAYKYVRDNYAIGSVVFYGNSMGGIESLNALIENKIPGVVAWVGTSPTTNLADNYANVGQGFQALITTAYGISGNYSAATAGRDPVLAPAYGFRGLPMLFLAATDDAVVSKPNNTDLLAPICATNSAVVTVQTGITGGHSFNFAPYTTQITTFFDSYTKSA